MYCKGNRDLKYEIYQKPTTFKPHYQAITMRTYLKGPEFTLLGRTEYMNHTSKHHR